MLMIRSKIKVENVEYGKGKAELISVQIMSKLKNSISPKKYRYLEWTEGRIDNGKKL